MNELIEYFLKLDMIDFVCYFTLLMMLIAGSCTILTELIKLIFRIIYDKG